eukprot:527753-Alexandrium_andersonii.AAC.1
MSRSQLCPSSASVQARGSPPVLRPWLRATTRRHCSESRCCQKAFGSRSVSAVSLGLGCGVD